MRLDELAENWDRINKMNRAFSMSHSIVKVLQEQRGLKESLGIVDYMSEMTRKYISSNSFQIQDLLSSSAYLRDSFEKSQSAYNSLKSISDQNSRLLELMGNFRYPYQHYSAFSQINNLEGALQSISKLFAASAAMQNNWELISKLESVTIETLELASEDEELTEEQSQKLNRLIDSILVYFKSKKQLGLNILLILDIILRLTDVHQYIDFLIPKSDNSEVVVIKRYEDLIKRLESRIKEEKEYRITNRACRVRAKPKMGSFLIAEIPKDFEVIVLQVQHKWVYISYYNPSDNLPESGWVLKKYLSRP